MTTWSLDRAEGNFRELLAACLKQGPQVVSENETEVAVLVSVEDWRRLAGTSGATPEALSPPERPRAETSVLGRGRRRGRSSAPLEEADR